MPGDDLSPAALTLSMSPEEIALVEAIRLTARYTPEAKGDTLYLVAWNDLMDATEVLWCLRKAKPPVPWPGSATGFSELAQPVWEQMGGGGLVGPRGLLLKITAKKTAFQPLMGNEVRDFLDGSPWDEVYAGLPKV